MLDDNDCDNEPTEHGKSVTDAEEEVEEGKESTG